MDPLCANKHLFFTSSFVDNAYMSTFTFSSTYFVVINSVNEIVNTEVVDNNHDMESKARQGGTIEVDKCHEVSRCSYHPFKCHRMKLSMDYTAGASQIAVIDDILSDRTLSSGHSRRT